jgi:UDP-GlcNAc:undecaprenyl-phosphate/decaprenyl-phosphate GlcNAc-1-phosphate transferase
MTLTLTPIAGFAVAFVLAHWLTPQIVRLAARLGAVDHRVTPRIHAGQVPRLGGIAIALGFYVPVLGLAFRVNAFSGQIYEQPLRVAALLVGGLIILGLGIFDDLRGAKAWQKLIVQVPVAALAWWAGVRIGGTVSPAGADVVFPQLVSLGVTVLWIVVVVNALNLIDGLDGLASGVAFQALAAAALIAWVRGDPALALFAICLCGSVGGFLVHNFHPASIFMGDSGSMFLGYVIAVTTAWSSQKTATMVGVVLPAIALGLPLLDTSMAVWRRVARGKPVMSGDLDHIHHRLLALGWSQRRSVLTLYAVSFAFSAVSVALVFINDWRLHWPLIGLSVMAALGFARWLGYLRQTNARRVVDAVEHRKAS